MNTCLLITTMDRTDLLRHSLTRLQELTLPDEILIVDDGGSDGAQHLAVDFPKLPIRYIYNNNPGQSICSFARNIGIKNTDCEFIITSEPEIIFLTDVIVQLHSKFEHFPNNVISAGVVFHAQGPDQRDPAQCNRIEGWVAPFTALYRRAWLTEVGGWDESFPDPWGWDDTDLLTRLRWIPVGQVIDPEIEVLHQFHGSSAVNQDANSAHFFNKHLDETPTHKVANKGVEWGRIKTT